MENNTQLEKLDEVDKKRLENFNSFITEARRPIECLFGNIYKKFQIMQYVDVSSILKASKIAQVVFLMWNYYRLVDSPLKLEKKKVKEYRFKAEDDWTDRDLQMILGDIWEDLKNSPRRVKGEFEVRKEDYDEKEDDETDDDDEEPVIVNIRRIDEIRKRTKKSLENGKAVLERIRDEKILQQCGLSCGNYYLFDVKSLSNLLGKDYYHFQKEQADFKRSIKGTRPANDPIADHFQLQCEIFGSICTTVRTLPFLPTLGIYCKQLKKLENRFVIFKDFVNGEIGEFF